MGRNNLIQFKIIMLLFLQSLITLKAYNKDTEPIRFYEKSKVHIDYQRQRAKEMTMYYGKIKRDKEIQEARILGWTPTNEIINGRWVMMGLAIGILTEYATGVNFIDQIKLTLLYLGIIDSTD